MSRIRYHSTYLIAAICIAAQSMALGHFLLVEHTRCAEHGEMVHGDGHTDHASDRTRSIAVTDDAVQADDAAHADGHEHCAATSDRKQGVCPAIFAGTPVAAVDGAYTHELRAFDVGAAIYCIAPKTSPPA